MLKTKQQKFIVIIILLLVSCFLIYFYRKTSPATISLNNIITIPKEEQKVDQSISELNFTYDVTEETNVYDFMNKLKDEGKINFTDRTYTGMGKFINSINGIDGNGGKNWIYYVNGKKAELGVSNYKINKGDIVSWKYEKSF